MRAMAVAALLCCAAADGPVALTAANWEAHVGGTDGAMVMFSAAWAPGTRHGRRGLLAVADQAGGVVVGHVDCQTERELCLAHSVEAYPTLAAFPAGGRPAVPLRDHRAAALLDSAVDLLGAELRPAPARKPSRFR